MASSRATRVAVFWLLTLIWGTTWAAIRVSLAGIPPLAGVALRFALAGLLLLGYARWRGITMGGSARERRLWVANAICTFGGSYSIVYWGEQWVPSGLASVLFATFPLWVAVFGHFLLAEEPLTFVRAGSAILGFLGVAVIFSSDFAAFGGPQVFRAGLVFLLAPILSAFGNVLVKRWGSGLSPVSITAMPMLLAAAGVGAVAAVVERGQAWSAAPAPWLAMIYLAVFGSAVTFTLYFWLVAQGTALSAAMMAYTIPVVAVLVGALFLDEPLTGRMVIGGALVLVGVGLPSWVRRPSPGAAAKAG